MLINTIKDSTLDPENKIYVSNSTSDCIDLDDFLSKYVADKTNTSLCKSPDCQFNLHNELDNLIISNMTY